MRSKFLLAALPAMILGLAACDDQTAQNQNQPGGTSTAERPAGGAPMPPAGTPGQNASGVGGTGAGGPMAPGAAPTGTAPSSTRPGGTSGNTQ